MNPGERVLSTAPTTAGVELEDELLSRRGGLGGGDPGGVPGEPGLSRAGHCMMARVRLRLGLRFNGLWAREASTRA